MNNQICKFLCFFSFFFWKCILQMTKWRWEKKIMLYTTDKCTRENFIYIILMHVRYYVFLRTNKIFILVIWISLFYVYDNACVEFIMPWFHDVEKIRKIKFEYVQYTCIAYSICMYCMYNKIFVTFFKIWVWGKI